MLKQIGQPIEFVAFFTSNKVGKTGLLVTVDIYANNALLATSSEATERAGGLYSFVCNGGDITAAGNYIAIFKTTDTTVDVQHVPSFFDVGQGWVEAAASSPNFDMIQQLVNDSVPSVDEITDAVWNSPTSSAAQDAFAETLEARLLSDGDGQAFVQAVVNAIGNSNVDQVALIQAFINALERAGGSLAAVKAKTDALPPAPAAVSDVQITVSAPVVNTSGGFASGDRTRLERIDAKFQEQPAPSVVVAPAPVPVGGIPLVPVGFDAITWGAARAGAKVRISLVETRPVVLAGRIEVPSVQEIMTGENGHGEALFYPSSVLQAAGVNPGYVVDSEDANIKKRLITIPNVPCLLSQLLS